ncbi:MAG: protein kinase [Rhodanobacteraceae bacterium]
MTTPLLAMRLFEEALFLDPDRRRAFLDRKCAGNYVLRDEVQSLLDADEAAGDFLSRPLAAPADRSGQRLGTYRLVQPIGSGGMGTVYRAERADGAYAKPVAIKLLLFDAGDLRARFTVEQRILGAFSHPNIANLLDIGNDANGAPYLVMEYVEGQPITLYADEHALDTRARVILFLKILDAVQAAHMHLVVHRDIKPSNVLVDAHGEPKLLDFGIAKLLDESAPATTRTGLVPLTPEYASPEQTRGEAVGTSSDIYSLGVLLYELVAGKRPYCIHDSRASAVERMICDSDPARPSSFFDTRRMGGSARDLDAIVLKAMEKSPRRRYASSAAFAEDLRRWLDGDVVQARQPAISERTLRFVRRHRLPVSVTSAALLALIVGSGFAVWQAHLARTQAALASSERDRAERINRFLTDTLAAANPANLGRKATVVKVLDRARQLADKELANDAQSAASAQLVLAQTYRALGSLDIAQVCAGKALTAAIKLGDGAMVADAESELGDVYLDKGNLPRARAVYELARTQALTLGDALRRGTTALQLGQIANEEGNISSATHWLTVALNELPGNATIERATAMDSRGFAADLGGDEARAIRWRRAAIDAMQAAFPHGHPLLAAFSVNLADSLHKSGRDDEAVDMLSRVLPMQIETLGKNAPDVIWTLNELTGIERQRKHLDAASGYAQRAFAIAQHLPDDNDWKAAADEKYGEVLIDISRPAQALPVLRKALQIDRAMLPPGHRTIASVESLIALAQSLVDRRASGEAQARDAYRRMLSKYGPANTYTIATKSRLDRIRALGTLPHAPSVRD